MNDQKLLFLSEKVDDLVQIIEGFISLLYPFDSRHLGLYMPVVPHNVAVQSDGVLFEIPMPFLLGMNKSLLKYVDNQIPNDVVRIDLVSNTVWQGQDDDSDSLPYFPTTLALRLYRLYHRHGGYVASRGTVLHPPDTPWNISNEEKNMYV